MGKTTDMFRRSKLLLPQNLPFLSKIYAAGRPSNIRVIDTKFKFQNKLYIGLTILKWCFSGMHGMPLMRLHKKTEKEDSFCILGVGPFKLLLLPNHSTSRIRW